MTTVVEQGGELRTVNLEELGPSTARWLPWPSIGGGVPFDVGSTWAPGWWGGDYVALYENQPEIRTCVDFLARNIAQIGMKVYRRLADDDREHLGDHGLEETLRRPSALVTRYAWTFGLVADLAIFDEHYSAIVQDGEDVALQRLPVPAVSPSPEDVGPGPTKTWVVRIGGEEKRVKAADMFDVHGYNPARVNRGLAPLDTLGSLLREEAAASAERVRYFAQRSSVGGVIERPLDAPKWSKDAADRFKADWQDRYAGPENVGKTPVLEDGMTFKPQTFSPMESQFVEGRKLAREEVARAYHIPPPMVGILDHATFSNISEQHRMLYQDTLGPWLAMLEEEIERQLLPRFADRDDVYVEFNIGAKLQGAFEEQIAALTTAIGRPYLSANEGRAILDYARHDADDADGLVLPLNVTTSVSGADEEPEETPVELEPVPGAPTTLSALALPAKAAGSSRRWLTGIARARARHSAAYERLLGSYFARQMSAVNGRVERIATARWNRELSELLRGLHGITAEDLGRLLAERFDFADFEPERMDRYLDNGARIDAEGIDATTATRVARELDVDEPPPFTEAYKAQTDYRAVLLAGTYATAYGMFGQDEVARQARVPEKV